MSALGAPPAVHWLLSQEPFLRQRMQEYLWGLNGHHVIPFTLPATYDEFMKHRRSRDNYKLMFPQIILRLRRVKNSETGQADLEVTCSDDDIEAIARYRRELPLVKHELTKPAHI